MTTTAAKKAILDQISADIRYTNDLIARMHRDNDWRADALERAGELALAGRMMESKAAAEAARN